MNPMHRGTRASLAISLLLTAASSTQAVDLSIYWNNDGESALLQDGDVGGISQFVGTLNALRNNDTNDILTLSAGDNIFPGPQFDAGFQDEALAATYRKMVKMGLPSDAVKHKMVQDGVSGVVIAERPWKLLQLYTTLAF